MQLLIGIASLLALLSAAATGLFFPWDVDPRRDESANTRRYYEDAYATGKAGTAADKVSALPPLSEKDQYYIDFARAAAVRGDVPGLISQFVKQFDLAGKKVLEVGAGSGLLQDAVADYTGLDISPTARRFFHKPFVEASATDMPFADNTFDASWSIWVLEHIPNPERALEEMRRVVKPGGFLFLMPAFDVSRFASQGYRVRPYADFGWSGKLTKVAAHATNTAWFHYLHYHQVLMLRSLGVRLTRGPSQLRFRRLAPNYEQYWEADGDAITSLSNHELYLWVKTRGDKCMNCPSEARLTLRDPPLSYLIVQKK